MMDQSTIWMKPARRATTAIMSSGALPKVAFRRPPIASPVRAARCSVAWTRSAAMGMMLRAAAKKTSGGDACFASSTNVTGTRANSQLIDGLRLKAVSRGWQVPLFNYRLGSGECRALSPIQTPVLNRLADVWDADLPCPSEIGNRQGQL